MIFPAPRFSPLGDGAVTINLADEISAAASDRVVRVAATIEEHANLKLEIVPSYGAVTVFYDRSVSTYQEIVVSLSAIIERIATHAGTNEPEPHLVRIPTIYDGEDLDKVAFRTELTRESLIELHSNREYRVYMLGFAPGFAYLGDLDPRLSLRRRDTPRKRVPSGSVAIAELQTAVYPSSTPGGWHLIGRTDLVMFDPRRDPPATLRAGDRVKFDPV